MRSWLLTTTGLVGICCLGIFCMGSFAQESSEKRSVVGTWVLAKWVNGKLVDERPGNATPIVAERGFSYLDDGEFPVPGEVAGSDRHTIPRGFHFEVRPKAITDDSVIADVLVSFTEIAEQSDDGFVAKKHQVDGRYKIKFGESVAVVLPLPDGKTTYDFSLTIRQKS